MKIQSTFYPDFISKTVDLLIINSFITKKCPIYWYVMHLRGKFARKNVANYAFCGVKFLAWKSGSVKFLTNSMSDSDSIHHPLNSLTNTRGMELPSFTNEIHTIRDGCSTALYAACTVMNTKAPAVQISSWQVYFKCLCAFIWTWNSIFLRLFFLTL